MDKVAVFIDEGYLSNLTKNYFKDSDGKPRRINFSDFSEKLVSEIEGELLRTYYYHCPPYQSAYPTEEEKVRKSNYDKFNYALRQLRKFQVRSGRLKKVYNEKGEPDFMQKGVDVLLAIDMVKLAMKGAIQKAIIVSGDSDFVPAVRAIKDEGVSMHIFYHNNKTEHGREYSDYLVQECDEKHELTEQHFDC